MSKGFIGTLLGIMVAIVGVFVFASYQNQKAKERFERDMAASLEQARLAAENASADQAYDKKLDDLATAAWENEQHQKDKQLNPPVYPKLSLKQTEDFIARVEKVRANDNNVENTTTSRAGQNRAYRDLKEEALHIYGEVEPGNKYKTCAAMVDFAALAFDLRFDQSFEPERRKGLIQTNNNMYQDQKKGCLEAVSGTS